jgi:hypothetical protein
VAFQSHSGFGPALGSKVCSASSPSSAHTRRRCRHRGAMAVRSGGNRPVCPVRPTGQPQRIDEKHISHVQFHRRPGRRALFQHDLAWLPDTCEVTGHFKRARASSRSTLIVKGGVGHESPCWGSRVEAASLSTTALCRIRSDLRRLLPLLLLGRGRSLQSCCCRKGLVGPGSPGRRTGDASGYVISIRVVSISTT